MHAGKPIIGIVGGIGSGKSHVARIFGSMGCHVIDSDQQARLAFERDEVKQALRSWWGDRVLDETGKVSRSAVAKIVFADPQQRARLEALIHPIVARLRDEEMNRLAGDPAIKAFVWDTPLLIEAGLHRQCDAVVFVDAPDDARRRRVMASRGWSEEEWARREKSQLPLDKKRQMANDMVRNTAGAGQEVRDQVREVLSRILAENRRSTAQGHEPMAPG
jgi:dephospho-CoA kinase